MLVCCDNEGCIVDAKGQRFDLHALHDLATDIADFPGAFTICTGRAVPYVEAMVQVLGLVDAATPCVCEGGGVFYTPCEDRYEAIADRVDCDAIRALLPVGSYREEPGKVTCLTAYPEAGYTVDDLYALVTAGRPPGVEVNRSIASVDVTPEGVDKMYGVRASRPDRFGLVRRACDWRLLERLADAPRSPAVGVSRERRARGEGCCRLRIAAARDPWRGGHLAPGCSLAPGFGQLTMMPYSRHCPLRRLSKPDRRRYPMDWISSDAWSRLAATWPRMFACQSAGCVGQTERWQVTLCRYTSAASRVMWLRVTSAWASSRSSRASA